MHCLVLKKTVITSTKEHCQAAEGSFTPWEKNVRIEENPKT